MRTEDELRRMLAEAVTGKPSMRLRLDDVVAAGGRAVRRRRVARAVTSSTAAVVAAAVVTAGASGWTAGLRGGSTDDGARPAAGAPASAPPRLPAGPPVGTAPPATGPSASRPSDTSRPAPPDATSRPALPRVAAAESCTSPKDARAYPGASAPNVRVPSVWSVRRAVLAAADRIAPGVRFTYVASFDGLRSAKTGDASMVVWFDATGADGTGGLGFEVVPFLNGPGEEADQVISQRQYAYCTLPRRQVEPDGSVGLLYRNPLGNPRRPQDVVGRASLFSSLGVTVNVDAVAWPYSTRWKAEQRTTDGGSEPTPTRWTLPLTPDQLYGFAQVVGSLPVGR